MFWRRDNDGDDSGYPDDWNRRRRQVFQRDNWECQACGRTGGRRGSAELHAHHIVPKSQAGGHGLDNLVTLCDRCHADYHNDRRLRADTGSSSPWWTFGLGNLLSWGSGRSGDGTAGGRRSGSLAEFETKAHRRKRAANEERRTPWHDKVDAGYNDEFDGCPSCGKHAISVRWEPRGDRRKKIIECTDCETLFNEKVQSGDPALVPITQRSDTKKKEAAKKKTKSEQSALAYEIEKHLEMGSFDQSDLSRIKKQLMEEVETEKERRHLEETFKEYEK